MKVANISNKKDTLLGCMEPDVRKFFNHLQLPDNPEFAF
jgi:hypothetical protein